MASIEKVSIALSSDMLRMVRGAVQTGDYASTSEVVREALREWKARRAVPPRQAPATLPLYPLSSEHREALQAICERQHVAHLALFGSILRPDFDAASDVDVAVDFLTPANAATARQYFDLKQALEALFGRSVDLVELSAVPDSRLKRIIQRSQVTVYAHAQAA